MNYVSVLDILYRAAWETNRLSKPRTQNSLGESSATNLEDELLSVKANYIVAHSVCYVNNCLCGNVKKEFLLRCENDDKRVRCKMLQNPKPLVVVALVTSSVLSSTE